VRTRHDPAHPHGLAGVRGSRKDAGMTTTRPALLVLALALTCGSDPGGSSSGQGGTTGAATAVEPTTGGAAVTEGSGGTSASGSESQGQTGGAATGASSGVSTSAGDSSGPDATTATTADATTATTGGSDSSTGGSSGGVDLCADFKQPNCFKSGCEGGFDCVQVEGDCVPSNCSCDPQTGLPGACTEDCGGGTCVAQGGDCTCMKDADCVKTSSGCCLCNAGGDEVPAHKACIEQVMLCDLPPDQVNCPQVFLCTDAKPACKAGVCVLQ